MESLTRLLPAPSGALVIDSQFLPMFHWKRPISTNSHLAMARNAIFVLFTHLSVRNIVTLFSAVCLEQFIIVSHPDPAVVTQVILALHFMIRPLHWVLGSVSLGPYSFMDLLHSPQPMLIGTMMRISHIDNMHIYVDLVKNSIFGAQTLPKGPNHRAMMAEMTATLKKRKSFTDVDLNCLMLVTNLAVEDILARVDACIITDITQENRQSTFFHELLLKQVPIEQREFMHQFSLTQMFQVDTEQECRRISYSLIPNIQELNSSETGSLFIFHLLTIRTRANFASISDILISISAFPGMSRLTLLPFVH
jgi:hypothetical protein